MNEVQSKLTPLVSVVIPTYSRCNTLVNAIESVLDQTYPAVEIIIVDDNQPNSQWRGQVQQIMEKYRNYANVHYVQNPQNLGGAGARNVGIAAAQGKYIAFLDDDDEYFPQKIEKQVKLFQKENNEKLALVFCDSVMTHDNDKFICNIRPRYKGCCLYEAMRDNCIAATSQWLVDKAALNAVGNFPIVPNKQDSQVILKLLSNGYEVIGVPEILSKYCNYEGTRISSLSLKNLEGELLYQSACRRNYDKLSYWQIQDVEYSFAQKLYCLYRANHMKKEKSDQLKIMFRSSFNKSLLFILKDIYHGIKDRVTSE